MSLALVPAAGRSTRMGRPKLLLPVGGDTLLGRLVGSLRAGGVERVLVVVPPDGDGIVDWARVHGVETTVNRHPERGMLSTIVAGLDALDAREEALPDPLLVTPADIPDIRADTIAALLRAWPAAEPLVVPTHHGKRGHPLLLSPALVAEIRDLDADVGLKQIRERHPVREIEVDDPGILRDVDTRADYERLLRQEDRP